VNSETNTSSAHIYADPDLFDPAARGGTAVTADDEDGELYRQQQHQIDPAHITIDAVVQRGTSLTAFLCLCISR